MSIREVDPHECCQACLGNTCDTGTCPQCENWTEETRNIFRARKHYKRSRMLLKKRAQENNLDFMEMDLDPFSSPNSLSDENILPCARRHSVPELTPNRIPLPKMPPPPPPIAFFFSYQY